jgi:hypothetical protein
MNGNTTANSGFASGGVSYSKDSFEGNQTLVFQIKFCGKSPALRVAANRYSQWYSSRAEVESMRTFLQLPLFQMSKLVKIASFDDLFITLSCGEIHESKGICRQTLFF